METFIIDGVRLVSPILSYIGPIHWHPAAVTNHIAAGEQTAINIIYKHSLVWFRTEIEQGRLRIYV